MSTTLGIRLQADPVRILAYTEISNQYAELGNAYEYPVRQYWLQNLTDVTLAFSWDGSTDNGVLAAGGFLLLDITSNKSLDQGLYLPVGGSTWITTVSDDPTSGGVYLTVFYSSPN